MASVVAESSPPDSSTTAFSFNCEYIIRVQQSHEQSTVQAHRPRAIYVFEFATEQANGRAESIRQ